MKKLLIVEDDEAILEGLTASLADEDYEISTATEGAGGFRMASAGNFDLIILDIMLPGKSGLDICRELRQNGNTAPIVMLTSKKEEIDKVVGFETGADDYITKPFSIIELKVRLRALMRRFQRLETLPVDNNYTFGNTRLELKKHEAFKDNKPLGLTAKEFQILKYFIEREGEAVSRDMLLDDIWGYDNFPTTRTVDNYILSLRKKIEENPSKPEHLLTVHTYGYKFLK